MMVLRSAAPSPFARKVRIALAILGLTNVKIEAADTIVLLGRHTTTSRAFVN